MAKRIKSFKDGDTVMVRASKGARLDLIDAPLTITGRERNIIHYINGTTGEPGSLIGHVLVEAV